MIVIGRRRPVDKVLRIVDPGRLLPTQSGRSQVSCERLVCNANGLSDVCIDRTNAAMNGSYKRLP